MSLVYRYRCDACGTLRVNLPKTWEVRNTWRDGSVTDHYCDRCQKRAKEAKGE